LLLLVSALALGACATQPSNKVDVAIGTQASAYADARDYAALYTPYAMMATAAYTDEKVLTNGCPDVAKLATSGFAKSPDDFETHKMLRKWVLELNHRTWHCFSGVVGPLPCPKKLGKDCHPVGGLEYQVWRRMDRDHHCVEVAIAFRGTDPNDYGDWVSNFRWLNRLVPKFDQYAQVQTHITQVVSNLQRGCGGGATQFVTVGHSLGGGLAQQAAYAERTGVIKYVYGFDPSPVTGFFDVSELVTKHSTDGLGVDRTYEQGEILMLPRLIIENIFPPADCHPRIRSVRFNVLTGLPGAQHSIADLTSQLKMMGKHGGHPQRVNDSLKARGCKGEPMMVPPA
jgi:hypothetical protein